MVPLFPPETEYMESIPSQEGVRVQSLLLVYRLTASEDMGIEDMKCVDGVIFLYLGDKALTIKIPLQRRG